MPKHAVRELTGNRRGRARLGGLFAELDGQGKFVVDAEWPGAAAEVSSG